MRMRIDRNCRLDDRGCTTVRVESPPDTDSPDDWRREAAAAAAELMAEPAVRAETHAIVLRCEEELGAPLGAWLAG